MSDKDESNESQENDPIEMIRRWLPVVGGGALALVGLASRSPRGVAMAVAGGALAFRSIRDQQQKGGDAEVDLEPAERGQGKVSVPHEHGIRVVKAFTINAPRSELYSFWRQFSNLPRFMHHLESVEEIGDGKSHWVAKAPAGQTVAWDAEIINEVENELLAWRSLENADVSNAGSVQFKDALGGKGTEVKVELLYDAPGGFVGSAIAKLFGEEPSQQVENDLRHFKQLMEAGEIPTTEGQSAGSRSKPGISLGPRIS